MPRYTADAIRNIALVGQSGSGKTTLVEALLHRAGVIGTPGDVEKGNTVCDFSPLEKAYCHSLSSTVVSFDHDQIHLNLIDTPGMPDFIGQSIAAFPAVETVAVVIDAVAGIEPVTRRMLEWAGARKLCRMIIINRIDAKGADLAALVEAIRDEFGAECLPLNLPAEDGARVVDCFFNPDGEADFSSVADAHGRIIDQVVEVDEALMELYLEQGQELAPTQLHAPFEQALREGHLVPVCFVSARSGAGVPELLEVFERLMPNPMEGNPRPFLIGEGEAARPFSAEPDPDRHVVAHVFKVMADPYVGKLGVFRIHQGTVTKDSQLFIGDGRKPFRVGHLFKLQGNTQIEVDAGIPGDICAVAKIEELHFDAVLHDSHEEDYLHLKALPFPVPVFGLAVDAPSRGDEQRLSGALSRLVEEDPCLHLEHDSEQNELVLRGLGELHLRVALEQMKDRFKVEAQTRPPRIPYRETIAAAAEGHYRHKKQTGGAGQFGEVFLRVTPLQRGAGFRFVDEVKGGTIPGQFIPAVEKGVRQAMQGGAVAGYPLQDIEVTVYDGKHHSVDSKEVAFVAAGKKAFLVAVRKARPLLLEPMISLDLVVPNEDVGPVTGDLTARRGQVLGTRALPSGRLAIKGLAPLAELGDYAGKLKSLTGGHGAFTLEFSHYQPAPDKLQGELAAQWRPRDEED
ncbi:MAG: elongation factor G [Gammaproteobacteria bacterium]|jgi:elongation factor G|nr:MAG: elongation factor G [Gammaproteobacteria bacterium]